MAPQQVQPQTSMTKTEEIRAWLDLNGNHKALTVRQVWDAGSKKEQEELVVLRDFYCPGGAFQTPRPDQGKQQKS